MVVFCFFIHVVFVSDEDTVRHDHLLCSPSSHSNLRVGRTPKAHIRRCQACSPRQQPTAWQMCREQQHSWHKCVSAFALIKPSSAFQSTQLHHITGWVNTTYTYDERQLRQALLRDSMRLLEQILQISVACMQQLTAQLSNPDAAQQDVLEPAATFCDAMEYVQLSVMACEGGVQPLTDTSRHQVLRMLKTTGEQLVS